MVDNLSLEEFHPFLDSISFVMNLPSDLTLIEKASSGIAGILHKMEFCPEDEILKVQLALIEMLTNAIEHGNLEIDGTTKAKLLEKYDDSFENLLDERLGTSPYKDRKVKLEFFLSKKEARFVITDEGAGFQQGQEQVQISQETLLSNRGILLAKDAYVDELYHNEKGNQVTLIKKKKISKL